MNDWQIASLIALMCWVVLLARGARSYRFSTSIVFRSILIWGAIVLVITVIVLNRALIEASLAPVRAMMP
jgi:hypothetical protein